MECENLVQASTSESTTTKKNKSLVVCDTLIFKMAITFLTIPIYLPTYIFTISIDTCVSRHE